MINLNSLEGFEELDKDPERKMWCKIFQFWNRMPPSPEEYSTFSSWCETVESTCLLFGKDMIQAVRGSQNYCVVRIYKQNVDIHVGYMTNLCRRLQVPYPVDQIENFMQFIKPTVHIPQERNQLAAKNLAALALKTPWMGRKRAHLVSLWYIMTLSL